MKRHDFLRVALGRTVLALGLLGLGLNALLLARALTGDGIVGCGGGSSCEVLLRSRWSQVFGVPVTVGGCVVYGGLLLGLTRRGRSLLVPCAGVIAGAAAWWILVQAVIVGRFCPWCMVAHGVGLAIVWLVGWRHALERSLAAAVQSLVLVGGAAAALVSILQVLGPRPVTHRLAVLETPMSAASVQARGDGRRVAFDGGRKQFNVAALPHLGPADAPHVMVEYFDYSCASCRTMRGYLKELLEKHAGRVCVVMLPVPMERSCNHGLGARHPEYRGACETVNLALAVWRQKPQAFADYHDQLLSLERVGDARQAALKILTRDELDAALMDPWLPELIQANVADWISFSAETDKLPKLLVSDRRILHGLPSDAASFIKVMEKELGLER